MIEMHRRVLILIFARLIWRVQYYCQLRFTSNARECVRMSVMVYSNSIRKATSVIHTNFLHNNIIMFCVAFQRLPRSR